MFKVFTCNAVGFTHKYSTVGNCPSGPVKHNFLPLYFIPNIVEISTSKRSTKFTTILSWIIYVAVQFYSWFKFYFPFFKTDCHILTYPKTKGNKVKTKDKIEPQHIYIFFLIIGVTYNIPVCVWLQENHPYVPPLVFVKPTSSMAIKPSHHVDTNGKVYLPFLNEWSYVCELCEIPFMPLYDETKAWNIVKFSLHVYEVLCAHVDRLGTDKNGEENWWHKI